MKSLKSLFAKAAVLTGATVASVSAFADAPNVTEVVSDIDASKAPIAAVAGASLGAYVGIRVWKMVRRAI